MTAGGTVTFTGGSTTPVALDPALTISDPDGAADLTGATVTISNGLISGDMLNFTTQNGITGSYYTQRRADPDRHANHRAIPDSAGIGHLQLQPATGDPTGGGAHTTRTISWQATDSLSRLRPQ